MHIPEYWDPVTVYANIAVIVTIALIALAGWLNRSKKEKEEDKNRSGGLIRLFIILLYGGWLWFLISKL